MLRTNKKTVEVRHYKDAAERHLQACQKLLKYLGELEENELNDLKKNERDNLYAEIFYLSGYVVECSINYQYLVAKGFNEKDDYYNRGKWDTNVDINKHFRFTQPKAKISSKKILEILMTGNSELPEFLRSLGGGSVILNTDESDLKRMQEKWDPSIRYSFESTGLPAFSEDSVKHIKAYFQASKNLFYSFFNKES